MELTGSTAIITGASGNLGSQIAIALAARGLNGLCHFGTNEANACQTADLIKQKGRSAALFQADLSKPGFESELFKQARRLGPVRVVVNSASIFARQPAGTFTPQEVAAMLAVNLAAPLNICNEFAKTLAEEGIDWKTLPSAIGTVINMVDVAGIRPWAQYAPYCAARAGLIGMTKSFARELAPGITVNAIAPGIVTWPGKMDPAEEQKQLALIPAARFGSPKDITRTIDFLLDNDYITGQTLAIDGGRSI
jgi:NAD(P)-dependent dehydrogenase (short-subunit alcohol dehydrogenase family)